MYIQALPAFGISDRFYALMLAYMHNIHLDLSVYALKICINLKICEKYLTKPYKSV